MPEPMTRPPNTPHVLTLPTRPCRSAGTARCRTVIEVVPQMNACAPNTKKIGRAIQRRGGQRQPQVRQGLDDQPDAHDVAQAHPADDPAVGQRPEQPADRATRS